MIIIFVKEAEGAGKEVIDLINNKSVIDCYVEYFKKPT